MSAPTDELPAIEIEGVSCEPFLDFQTETAGVYETCVRPMTLPDLIALVIALPDDEQALALTEALSERFAKTGRADDWWANVLEDKSKRVDSLTAELGAARAELDRIRKLAAESAKRSYWLGPGRGLDPGEHWRVTLEEIAGSGRSPEEKRDG